jgi:hypothetical protein
MSFDLNFRRGSLGPPLRVCSWPQIFTPLTINVIASRSYGSPSNTVQVFILLMRNLNANTLLVITYWVWNLVFSIAGECQVSTLRFPNSKKYILYIRFILIMTERTITVCKKFSVTKFVFCIFFKSFEKHGVRINQKKLYSIGVFSQILWLKKLN